METDVQVAVDELKLRLSSTLGGRVTGDRRPQSVQVVQNPYSYTVRLQYITDVGPKAFYAKIPIVDDHNRSIVLERLSGEFDCLRHLARVFADEKRLDVVEAVAYYDDIPALLTEEATGPTLHDLVLRDSRRLSWGQRSPDTQQLCWLAGRWLDIYQRSDAHSSAEVDVQELIDYCSIRLDRLVHDSRSNVDREFKTQFERHLLKLSDLIAVDSATFVPRHNDYAPHNIIVTSIGISVLDFTMHDRGAYFFDLTRFWDRLESFKADPLHDSGKLSRMQAAFLSGYSRGTTVDCPGFRIGRCKTQLMLLAATFESEHRSPYARWLNGRVRRRSESWLLKEIQRSD